MQALIKRFTQQTTDLNLVLISMTAALTSLELGFLSPVMQFIITAVSITSLIYLLHALEGYLPDFQAVLSILLSALILLLSYPYLYSMLAVFMAATITTPFRKTPGREYLNSFSTHVADALITAGITGLDEANPFMSEMMKTFGDYPALLISKTVLVGLPLLYSYRFLEDEAADLFVRTVLVLGLSLSSRSLYLIFSTA
ncbi:MAG: hypothetical protein ABEK16_00905 [Candidatus Nanohalobium sp.]